MADSYNCLLCAFACYASLCACPSVVRAVARGDASVGIERRDYDAIIAQMQSQMVSLTPKVEKCTDDKEGLKAPIEALGSTYVRWGRKTCSPNATLVYSGVAGGKFYSETGGGTNHLCLTLSPQFDDVVPPTHSTYGNLFAYIYGAEYETQNGLQDHDVPCAVCRASQVTTLMIPGTLTCPPGWTTQYTGHLFGERFNHQGGEYVCLDYNPETTNSGVFNHGGNLFYYVSTVCGSLPCPPYAVNKAMTCVVCSS